MPLNWAVCAVLLLAPVTLALSVKEDVCASFPAEGMSMTRSIYYGDYQPAGSVTLTQEAPGVPIRVSWALNANVRLSRDRVYYLGVHKGDPAIHAEAMVMSDLAGGECPQCSPDGYCGGYSSCPVEQAGYPNVEHFDFSWPQFPSCPSSGRGSYYSISFGSAGVVEGSNFPGGSGYTGESDEAAMPEDEALSDNVVVDCSDKFHLNELPDHIDYGWGEKKAPTRSVDMFPIDAYSMTRCKYGNIRSVCDSPRAYGSFDLNVDHCGHCIWIFLHFRIKVDGYVRNAWAHNQGETCWCSSHGAHGGCVKWGTYCCETPKSGSVCRNGIVEPGEECDDGNEIDDDDCTNHCTLPTCGDGILHLGEECDEPDDIKCHTDPSFPEEKRCKWAFCGDGIIDYYEEDCDWAIPPGAPGYVSNCPSSGVDACQLEPVTPSGDPVCGNGIKETGEECDDGNDIDNDGCHFDCTRARCGNGILELEIGEDCDDGPLNGQGPCTEFCLLSSSSGTTDGDPHFVAFYGGHYDVMGEPGKVFNIFTDTNLHVNARFVQYPDSEATYIGEVGILSGMHKIYLDTTGGAVFDPWVEPQAGGVFPIGEDAEVVFRGQTMEVHHGEWIVRIVRMSVVRTGESHLDVSLFTKTGDAPQGTRVHGLLGQTARHVGVVKSLGQQGEGVIEGTYTDYIVQSDDVFGTDFVFNRFQMAE